VKFHGNCSSCNNAVRADGVLLAMKSLSGSELRLRGCVDNLNLDRKIIASCTDVVEDSIKIPKLKFPF
jgi:hypothetical protein